MNPAPDDIGEAVRNTCILATVRLRALGLNRTDKEASRTVESDHGAVSGAARVVVSRLPGADEHHRRIVKAQSVARQQLISLSMPYGNDDGWRLLPNVNFQPLLERLANTKTEVDQAIADFKSDLPNVIARAKANKGDLNVAIPSEQELLSAYHMETEFREIAIGTFKGLPPSTAAKLSRHSAAKMANAVEMAITDTLSRFVNPLEHFIERVKAFEDRERAIENGDKPGRVGVLYDSVLTNLQEVIEVVESFNVTGDPRLEHLQKMKHLLSIKPEDLRKNPHVRQQAVQSAHNMLADLNDWMAPLQRAA